MARRALPFLLAAAASCAGSPDPGLSASPRRILFVIADDWGPDHAGAYGCRWTRTPSFDRVAREGLLFTRAYTPNAKCAPSRAVLLTGRNPWQLEEAANHVCFFPEKFGTWPEALARAGWTTGLTGKGWGPGTARTAEGSPRPLVGKSWDARKLAPPTKGISPNDYAANFEDFLAAAPKDRPWMFWVGMLEPHRGYEHGSGVAKGGKRLSDIDRVPRAWPDTDVVRHDLLDYAYEVEHIDRQLGRMLGALERRGELDGTLVVVTSDHGMPFPRAKGQAYDPGLRVPLAIRWPEGIRDPGRRLDALVSFVDVAPTLLDLAGLPAPGGSPGRSWVPDLIRGGAGPMRDHVLVGQERHDVGRPGDAGYPVRGIVTRDRLYLRNHEPGRWPSCNPETGYLNTDGGATKTVILEAHRRDAADPHWALCFGKRGAEELYDLAADPDCVVNLAGDPREAGRLAGLRALVEQGLRAEGDPRVEGKGAVFDAYPYAEEGLRNFHARFLAGEKLRAGWVNEGDFEK